MGAIGVTIHTTTSVVVECYYSVCVCEYLQIKDLCTHALIKVELGHLKYTSRKKNQQKRMDSKKMKAINFLRRLWHLCIYMILWTPANASLRYGSERYKLYFRYQSSTVHSHTAIISVLNAALDIILALLTHFSYSESFFLLYSGVPLAILNILNVIGMYVVHKFCPDKAYKIGYVFVLLSFAVSFELLAGAFYNSHLSYIFETHVFATLIYLLTMLTLLFQWSTLVTGMLLTVFGLSFLFNLNYGILNKFEVRHQFVLYSMQW